jgi:hypothetical protein
VQPVQVTDLVRSLCTTIETGAFSNETVAIGGPDVLTIQALLEKLRVERTGKPGRVVHVPLALCLPPLLAAEAVGLGRWLPMTVGQLGTFRFDGVAVADHRDRALDRECDVFARHLVGEAPDDYVRRKYVEAHAVMRALAPADRFDAFLLRVASAGTARAKIADAYARVFRPTSAVRKKLVLLLAILETCRSTYRSIDAGTGGPPLWVIVRLAGRGMVALASLVLGVLLFQPARFLVRGPIEPR